MRRRNKVEIATRNASLEDLANLLQEQHARKIDMVVPANKMRMKDAVLHVEGAEAELLESGVVQVDGRYVPTTVFDEGVSQKLQIPLPYVRRMRQERPDLYDLNVNGWLHGGGRLEDRDGATVNEFSGDLRKFLVRAFRGDDGCNGIARAFLSDSYKMMDNLDALMAALDGVREAGVTIQFDGCDLTERRMTVKIVAPEIAALAPTLLEGYRSPFGGIEDVRALAASEGMGYAPGGEPIVFAGFVLSNSETGGGAFTLTPRLVIKVCKNGLMVTKDALRAVHLGGKMEEGVIQWSGDTMKKTADLITAKTRDAVKTFLDQEYMEKTIRGMEQKAGVPVEDPVKTVQAVGKKLAFSEDQIKGVLDHFVRGGQMNAAGVMNAVTSYAQVVEDADVAYEMEAQGLRALELASA
jgi:hypothetical protein